MASGPITSWQIDEGKMETVTDFIFLGSKITVKLATVFGIWRSLVMLKETVSIDNWAPKPIYPVGGLERSFQGDRLNCSI